MVNIILFLFSFGLGFCIRGYLEKRKRLNDYRRNGIK